MSQTPLLDSAKAGSGSALARLLEQFRPHLRERAQVRVDSRWQARADESDLVQLTLFTATHAFPAFRGDSEREMQAWLEAILQQHLAAMARFHLRTEKRSVNRETAGGPADDSHGGWQPPAVGPTPSGLVMQGEMRTQIERALDMLPWDQREAVRLRFLHEWSTEQIAEFLNRTERAVAGLLYRGLNRLKDAMRESS
jgi:RNA polymerase sigma-70 factor (ECF subfamily)